MQIKEVAHRLNVSPRAIRFYEEKGLLTPSKKANRYRSFSEKDIWRLQTIISLREVGMPIEDIRHALETIDQNDKGELLYYLELQRAIMFSQWVELKQTISTTNDMIDTLQQTNTLAIKNIYELANRTRKLRECRHNWRDLWDFDQRAETHDELVANNISPYNGYDEVLDCIVRTVAPASEEKGLDVGTGTGNLAARFMDLGIQMAGMDQSKEMLRRCNHKHPNYETRLGNALSIPYLDDQFDFAVSSFAFHHLIDDQQCLALDEMRRVLKPKGRMCIADDFADCVHVQSWFDEHGYITQQTQLNETVTVIYAVPIR